MKNKEIKIVLFGRTNVGKSTLFNTLTEQPHKALVSNTPGTTRDINIGKLEWQGWPLTLVDTGGIMDISFLSKQNKKATDIDEQVQKQARYHLTRANIILFTVDTRDGLLVDDREMAKNLLKIIPKKSDIILIANKADSPKWRREIYDFNKLGLGDPLACSAANGSGTGDLLDEIVKRLKTKKTPKPKAKKDSINKVVSVGLIGKPNVGKSSLANALLGKNEIIVSPTAHTTREPKDIQIKFEDLTINFIDTAGISKQGKKSVKKKIKKNSLERLSIKKSLHIIKRADIALLIIDIKKGLTIQEAKLVEEIVSTGTSIILIANKWDLVEERDTKKFKERIYDKLPFIKWAPIQFTSALTKEKVDKLLPLIKEVFDARCTQVSDNALARLLNRIVKKHSPKKAKGTKHPYIFDVRQTHAAPPRFKIKIRAKDTIHFSYIRFIENRIREKFGFIGTPIRMYVEKNKLIHGKHDLIKTASK